MAVITKESKMRGVTIVGGEGLALAEVSHSRRGRANWQYTMGGSRPVSVPDFVAAAMQKLTNLTPFNLREGEGSSI